MTAKEPSVAETVMRNYRVLREVSASGPVRKGLRPGHGISVTERSHCVSAETYWDLNVCEGCGDSFPEKKNRARDLQRHLKTCSGRRFVLQCPKCGENFEGVRAAM